MHEELAYICVCSVTIFTCLLTCRGISLASPLDLQLLVQGLQEVMVELTSGILSRTLVCLAQSVVMESQANGQRRGDRRVRR